MKSSTFERKLSVTRKAMGYEPSPHQVAIFDHIANSDNNLIVEAAAGSGKSTTIFHATRFCPMVSKPSQANPNRLTKLSPSILYLVFNKKLQEEAQSRSDVPNNVDIKTTHAFGFGAIRNCYPRPRDYPQNEPWINLDNYKLSNIYRTLYPNQKWNDYRHCASIIANTISAVKNAGIDLGDIDIDGADEESMDVLSSIEAYLLEAMGEDYDDSDIDKWMHDLFLVWNRSQEDIQTITFDDMLYLPTTDPNIKLPYFSWVFIDEAQDLNPCQIKLLMKFRDNHPETKFVFVGDRSQAIYAFRGADAVALDRIEKEFSCDSLPLSVTFRCPRLVVQEAHKYRTNIEPAADAPDGVVSHISEDDYFHLISRGDLTLCRSNAPLVRLCVTLLRKGFQASIIGNDLGKGIKTLYEGQVKPLLRDHNNNLYNALEDARTIALGKLNRPGDDMLAASTDDRFSVLKAMLSSPFMSDTEVKEMISRVFTHKQSPISLSTIHRAKGLEADNVFLIRPDLVPHPRAKSPVELDQELNLGYVAVTRAKSSFFYVTPPPKNFA